MPAAPALPRSSGVLLHPTSLPRGRLGPEALAFVDWLAQAGQSWWQVLPLGPPDEVGSPYRSASAFAGWRGLLAEPEAPVSPGEVARLREREGYWLEGWERFAGAGAAADQVRFEREWGAVRQHARRRGLRIIGDAPIYAGPDSADTRSHPRLFRRDGVAGVPPDAFSVDGQLWGNPLYDWAAIAADGHRFWIERLRRALSLADWVRIDHFRAFAGYWIVPNGSETARDGNWVLGPGAAPLVAAAQALGGALPLVAEDLGVITRDVEQLRDALGLPGMRVVQFAFDGDPANLHLPANHPERALVYTATHDNDTSRGWLEAAAPAERAGFERALAGAGIDEPDPAWAMIRLALSSPARVAITPAQDVLSLGSEARLNLPGTAVGNWSWRLEKGALTPALAARLRSVTALAGRLAPARA